MTTILVTTSLCGIPGENKNSTGADLEQLLCFVPLQYSRGDHNYHPTNSPHTNLVSETGGDVEWQTTPLAPGAISFPLFKSDDWLCGGRAADRSIMPDFLLALHERWRVAAARLGATDRQPEHGTPKLQPNNCTATRD